nr:hypothetical protein [Tanacetum cinerariifolium]
MAFISLAKHSSGNEDGNTACVPTASTNVPTASTSVSTISQDTACAYIASQSSGKKISIQGPDVAGFDKSKVECFNCHKMGHFVRECRAPRSQDRGRRDNFRHGSKAKEHAPKALMAIDRVGWDWSYMANDGEDHALFVKLKDNQSESKTYKKETPKKLPVKYAEQYRQPNKKRNVRGNQRNWNNLKSHQLGPKFVMKKKACFNCGDFNHLAYDCKKRVKKNFTPRPVAHKPYRPLQSPMKTNMNGARPNKTFFNKQAHSYANRPIHRTSVVRSSYRAPWVPFVNRNYPLVNRKFSTGSRNFPTANRKFSTVSRKFPTGCTKSPTADMGMKGKAINPSACWSWKPLQNLYNKGNRSYLSDYEPFDEGYVSFGQGGCKITRKGTIKTGRDFKLCDDTNVLLRTPRQHNMYSIDLNNIVSHRDLTCLVAKAYADECML